MRSFFKLLTAVLFLIAATTGCEGQLPPVGWPSDDAVWCDYDAPFGGEVCDGWSTQAGALEIEIIPLDDTSVALEVSCETRTQINDNDWVPCSGVEAEYLPNSMGSYVITMPNVPPEGYVRFSATLVYWETTKVVFDEDNPAAQSHAYSNGYELDADAESRSGEHYLDINLRDLR